MKKKTIALDIGNVCIRLRPGKCAEALGLPPSIGIPEELMDSVDKIERNLISEQQWMKDFHEITDHQFTNYQLRSAYNQVLGEEIEGIKEFLQQKTEEGYRIIFFSDTSEIHINSVYRELSFANIITGGVFSFDTGAKKPEPGMYEAFEKLYGKPDIYLDDKLENIKAGRKRGWNSYVFSNIDKLMKELYSV
jgi:glucose-1-phosphatase